MIIDLLLKSKKSTT